MSFVFVVAQMRKGSRLLPCLVMKEKIEILRSLAEAILDELAEMEVLTNEESEVFENVCGSVADS